MGVSERNHHVDIFHQFWENSGCSIPITKDDLVSFFPCYSGMLGNPFNNPVLLNGPHLNTDGISERALFCC